MKTLFLVRHSKADDNSSNDFDRKLTFEGVKLAQHISNNLSIFPLTNATFISSPALRAIETAKVFAKCYFIDSNNIIEDPFLYRYFTHDRFFMWLDSIEKNEEVWVFGHNPMFSELLVYLTNGDIFSMPKCSVAAFKINTENWFDTTPKNSKLLFFKNPKNKK